MSKTVFIKGTSIGEDVDYIRVYHTAIISANKIGNPSYTRSEIIDGVYISGVPDTADTFFLATDYYQCSTSGSASLPPSPSVTPSPTVTPTPTPTSPLVLSPYTVSGPTNLTSACNGSYTPTSLYWVPDEISTGYPNTAALFYEDPEGTTLATSGYYHILEGSANTYMKIGSGAVLLVDTCP